MPFITWKYKRLILQDISRGLREIHEKNVIHRDLHSGNILLKTRRNDRKWYIGDLGLSQPVDNTPLNNEIYGVIPYIAPEIYKGVKFSKESDIYSLGMIMWELTSCRKPFDNLEHDHKLIYKIIDGKRPEITHDTPECYANLMKRCWNPDPSKRPLITEICKSIDFWLLFWNHQTFNDSEEKRLKLIQSTKFYSEFIKEPHPKAVYMRRTLSIMTKESNKSSSSSSILSNTGQEYISRDQEYDINDIQRISAAINFSKKRNIDELKAKNPSNHGKRYKIDDNIDPKFKD
ncbi:2589_t:CDS:2 [Funneliformis geosporum]|nr:2589_t:CDS:2 [Funneliformis geosporum]